MHAENAEASRFATDRLQNRAPGKFPNLRVARTAGPHGGMARALQSLCAMARVRDRQRRQARARHEELDPEWLARSVRARHPRILIAEDDHEIRLALKHLLTADGYRVTTVSNGAELLDVLASWILREGDAQPADAIVTDVRMPGFSGLEIIEGLRANGWDQPVIVISAFGDAALRERLRRLTDVAFLAKPFEPDQLEGALESLLAPMVH